MKIPCTTIVRMGHITKGWHDELDAVFRTIRLEDNKALCTDRKLMVIERVPGITGTHHLLIDDALMEQCRVESQFASVLELVAIPGAVIGKTTMGFTTGNLAYSGSTAGFDDWRTVVSEAAEPLTASTGVMTWDTDTIARLGAASPSGVIEFARYIDAMARATLVRDISTHDWLGLFHPKVVDGVARSGASVPGWVL